MLSISASGISLDIHVIYFESTPATKHQNGYSELSYRLESGTDEIGETISKESLDLISIQFQSDIERAIWAQIGR